MNLYHKHPVFLLYWVVLKKGRNLKDWKRDIYKMGKENEYPYSVAIKIINEYGI